MARFSRLSGGLKLEAVCSSDGLDREDRVDFVLVPLVESWEVGSFQSLPATAFFCFLLWFLGIVDLGGTLNVGPDSGFGS